MLIELGAALVMATSIAAFVAWIWSRPGSAPVSRNRRIARGAMCIATGVLATSASARSVMNARVFQPFGTIVARVETDEPLVALTFDDGPTPAATDEIIAMLERDDVVATFFLNGNSIEQHPDATRRLVAAGHEIGNHSYSHPRLVAKSLAHVRDEVERADDAIRNAGYDGPVHFRPPYGNKLLVLPYYLARAGRTTVTWDVEPDSYPDVAASPERIVSHVVERTRPGSIILLHVMFPSRRTSLDAVPGIIAALHARGFRFVTVTELLAKRS